MAFNLQSIDNLFPTPIMHFEVANAGDLNRRLLEEIAARREKEAGIVRSNLGGWHSADDFFKRTEPAHRELALDLMRMMADMVRHFDPSADYDRVSMVPDGWINVNPPGAYNGPHDHKSAFWSGTYYVDVPDGEGSSGIIEFLSPNKALPGYGAIRGPLTRETYGLRPTAGMALIFPATIVHWVHPNLGDRDRVTIAFNGRFEAKR